MNLHNNKIKIFGVPLDLGSERLGVEMGPTAIRYAGLHEALRYNHIEFEDYGDLMINRHQEHDAAVGEIGRIAEKLAQMVADAVQRGFLPMVLGGDHSASIGSIAGAAKNCKRLGMIWADCHPDANTPETSPTGNVHGMTVAISLGHGYPELVNCCGFSPKVRPEDVCIIGAKNIDPGEREFLTRLGVKMYTLADVERLGIVSVVDRALQIVTSNTDAVHVSFDIDVLDPLIAPGTGITSRGGTFLPGDFLHDASFGRKRHRCVDRSYRDQSPPGHSQPDIGTGRRTLACCHWGGLRRLRKKLSQGVIGHALMRKTRDEALLCDIFSGNQV